MVVGEHPAQVPVPDSQLQAHDSRRFTLLPRVHEDRRRETHAALPRHAAHRRPTVTRVLPYRGQVRPRLAVRGKKRELDEHGRPVCKRGHVVQGDNVVMSGQSAACKTCANALGWANRHRMFVDDPRVVEHMRKTYERLMGSEVDTPPTGG